jgi:hypothetical protein
MSRNLPREHACRHVGLWSRRWRPCWPNPHPTQLQPLNNQGHRVAARRQSLPLPALPRLCHQRSWTSPTTQAMRLQRPLPLPGSTSGGMRKWTRAIAPRSPRDSTDPSIERSGHRSLHDLNNPALQVFGYRLLTPFELHLYRLATPLQRGLPSWLLPPYSPRRTKSPRCPQLSHPFRILMSSPMRHHHLLRQYHLRPQERRKIWRRAFERSVKLSTSEPQVQRAEL